MMLDPVLLRSFVAVVDTGSFTRAADSVHLTQSTISQQIRRLEMQVGCDLLNRSGRYVTTTLEGERLLRYAHRIAQLMDEAMEQIAQSAGKGEVRLGVPEDFVGRALTPTLSAFIDTYSAVRLEVSSGMSHELWQRFQRGELDLALIKQRVGSMPGLASWSERLCWVESRSRPNAMHDPIPLVVFPIGGLYRSEMMHALDAAGLRWRITYVSASLASVSAAVEAGLGVTLLPRRLLAAGHRMLDAASGFKVVPPLELALHGQTEIPVHAKDLAARLISACDQIMQA